MGAHIRDLTGQRFGNLVVLRMLDERKNNLVMWECQCDCGNVVELSRKYITNSAAPSCGCLWGHSGHNTKSKDITGRHFGRLTAISPTESRKNGSVVWACQCDCGNMTYVAKDKLITGNTTSCGCLRKENLSLARAIDLAGIRFGRLVAVRPTEERRNTNIVWECKCDCGKTTYVIASSLKRGITVSCGCLQKEKASNVNMSDLSKERFGKLKVIAPTQNRKRGYVVWHCECDCGNTIDVSSWDLKNGAVCSCGCEDK